jgi:recombination protein RecT
MGSKIMSKELAPYKNAILKAQEKFTKIASTEDYDKESIFAMQAIMKSDFAMKIANDNPTSVHLAMLNVASTGLTLNPAHGYAYLVPRDKAIRLDISYKGLIKIATDTGSVLWARADLVHENDTFTYNGPAAAPTHQAKPFKDRGEFIGAYCIAKTKDGDILTEVIDKSEIENIRNTSQSYLKRSGPWIDWFSQMVKKTVIKRASKTWPYTDRRSVLNDAIELANDAEGGYVFAEPVQDDTVYKGRPHDGAWLPFDESQKDIIHIIAQNCKEYYEAGDIVGLVDYLNNRAKVRDNLPIKNDSEAWIALDTLLDSKIRTAIKKETNARKAA